MHHGIGHMVGDVPLWTYPTPCQGYLVAIAGDLFKIVPLRHLVVAMETHMVGQWNSYWNFFLFLRLKNTATKDKTNVTLLLLTEVGN